MSIILLSQKQGSTKKAEKFAKENGALLFDLKDIDEYFSKTS